MTSALTIREKGWNSVILNKNESYRKFQDILTLFFQLFFLIRRIMVPITCAYLLSYTVINFELTAHRV